MNWSLPLLRLRGIDIKVHSTFALILIWAAWYWGTGKDAGLQGALFGVVATLLLFVCVTLHELGHAFTAQRYGIAVKDITLLPIGGVARLEVLPESPKQELWITAAGPAVNIAIAAMLLAVGAVLQTTALMMPGDLVDTMGGGQWGDLLPYLTVANLSLAIFNAIPAFPLDGGRILRALLALRIDYVRATRIAVTVGQGIALLLGLVGLASGDIFLIAIAAFVWFAAAQEGTEVAQRPVLGGATVGQAMIQRPQVLNASDPLGHAVDLTLGTAQADFPVIEPGGRVVGLLTLDDLLQGLRDTPSTTVGDVMRQQFPVVQPDESVASARGKLRKGRVRALPVLQPDGRLAGLLTLADIAEAFGLLAARPHLTRAAAVPVPPVLEAGPVQATLS